MNKNITPDISQSGENKEILSFDTIKQEFLTILDDFIKALKQSVLVDLNRENVDIVDALLHNITIKNNLTFTDFSLIFGKDLRSPYEVNTEILNEINSFVSEYSEFFKGGYVFKSIFQRERNLEYTLGGDYHKIETIELIEIMSRNLAIEKQKKEGNGNNKNNNLNFDFNSSFRKKIDCKSKLENLSEIDLNIPGYIVLMIFRDILNEQENIGDFMSYASTIQNSFLTKDTALGERIDDFFLKYSTVESTVDRVSKAVSGIRCGGENPICNEDIPY